MREKENEKTQLDKLAAKMRELTGDFQARLPETLKEIRDLAVSFQEAPGPESLREIARRAHKLAGAGGTFGLPELSRTAGLVEGLAAEIQAAANYDPVQVRELVSLVDSLVPDATPGADPEFWGRIPRRNLATVAAPLILIFRNGTEGRELAGQMKLFGYDSVNLPDPVRFRDWLAESPSREFSAIFIDATFLPEYEGIRERIPAQPDLPVIFFARADSQAIRLRAIQAGGRAFFQYPPKIQSLVSRLDEFTARIFSEPLRILLMDDDRTLVTHYSRVLEAVRCQTRAITQPEDFLLTVAQFQPDLILLDLYINGKALGLELARMIEQHEDYFTIPIVFLSTEEKLQRKFRAIAAGGENFLTKPVSPMNLVHAVVLRARRARKARHLLTRDGLTGLLNFASVEKKLDELWELVKKGADGRKLALGLVDIDHFKKVNDTYGHPTGDLILQTLGRMLMERFREPDVAGRHGGEEFLILLPDTNLADARALLELLREDFSKIMFYGPGGEPFHCTLSCGIVAAADLPGPRAAIQNVDAALYRAKKNGRDRVETGTKS